MSEILDDWNRLDKPHKEFVLRAELSNGCKHGCEPHYHEYGEIAEYGPVQTSLWDRAESSGFVECIGSYKWVVTDKFRDLQRELYGI